MALIKYFFDFIQWMEEEKINFYCLIVLEWQWKNTAKFARRDINLMRAMCFMLAEFYEISWIYVF